MNISANDENGEEVFNIFRNLLRDISNITMYDTYHDFLENNINNTRSRYTNNNNNNNNNNNHSTTYDICNNMVFTVINEYNVNMLEYNVNMREYLINNSNATNHNINANNTNNTDNINTNFIEYNNNVSDYNSNMRRFLDLISTINYNISTNNSRNYRTGENIRQEPRQTYRTNTTNSTNANTNRTNRTNPFGRNPVYTYTPTQLLSYYLPSRQRTFTNVVVRPSELQIIDATQLINYSDSETYNNTSCPITMEEFNNGEQICQIKHCGHNFREDALRNWFTTNVRCPICRYDIRDYVNGDADVSNNNIANDVSSNTENTASANNVRMDYSMNNIPLNNNSNSTQSLTNNLSSIIQSYLNQNLNPFVEELNSNLSEFDIVFPIIYYNDASGYYYDASGLTTHR